MRLPGLQKAPDGTLPFAGNARRALFGTVFLRPIQVKIGDGGVAVAAEEVDAAVVRDFLPAELTPIQRMDVSVDVCSGWADGLAFREKAQKIRLARSADRLHHHAAVL